MSTNQKIKVLTVIGTRPEIIRLSRVISKLDIYTDHTLVHTGQNYDYTLNKIFFEDLDIREPDYFLNCAQNSQSPANTIGNIISEVDDVLESIKPDAMLVLGDTNSCLSVIAAKRKKIPIFHMEAGNRCFDLRVPEEINRKIVDHTSDINLTYSDIARNYLLREGLAPDQIIKIGSPMNEVLNFYMNKITSSKILRTLNLKKRNYFVISVHREENIDSDLNFNKLISVFNFLGEKYKLPIIISAHPRTYKKLNNITSMINRQVRLLDPLSFTDYIQLQMSAKLVISDSGTITEESSLLNFPAINLRESHERPEGMEEASVILSGLDLQRVQQSIEITLDQYYKNNITLKKVSDYDVINVSDKVVRIILSYTNYVNRIVWKKYD